MKANRYQFFSKAEKYDGEPDYASGKTALEAADALAVIDRVAYTETTETTERTGSSGSLSPEPKQIGRTTAQMTLRTLWRNDTSGNPASNPETHLQLLAAGFKRDLPSGATSPLVRYQMDTGAAGRFMHGEPLLIGTDPIAIGSWAISSGTTMTIAAPSHGYGAGAVDIIINGATYPGDKTNPNMAISGTIVDANTLSFDIGEASATGYSGGTVYLAVDSGTLDVGRVVGYVDSAADAYLVTEAGTGFATSLHTLIGYFSRAACPVKDRGANDYDLFGQKYVLTSTQAMSVSRSDWTSSGVAAAGDLIGVYGQKKATGIVISDDPTNDVLLFEPGFGKFEDGDVIELLTGTHAGKQSTLGGAPTQVQMISTTDERRLDGELVGLRGARGNLQIAFRAGQQVEATWTKQGLPLSCDTLALDSAVALQTLIGTQFQGKNGVGQFRNLTSGEDLEFCIESADVDVGNQFGLDTCHAEENGARGYIITARQPRFSATIRAEWPVIKNWREIKKTGSELIDVALQAGSEAGKRVLVHMPAIQLDEVADGDTENIVTYALQGTPVRSGAGDTEIAIYFI